jgi:thioredoxin/glutathione reductase (selenoprotein)
MLRGSTKDGGSSSSSTTATAETKSQYEYDLAVIGGGSGGMAAAKEAAKYGANVVLFDYVKPSTQGTTWGLGGTCVNVGCVPKKLMHRAAVIGQTLHDAHHFGWSVTDESKQFDWGKLVTNTRNHVRMLNFGYKKGLKSADVKYINGLASFPADNDGHTLEYKKRFKEKEPPVKLTFDKVLIAVGGRPTIPKSVPGAIEYAITSDDIFYLNRSPGKTLVVGAGYIALECGGFLTECGFEVDIAVRSIILRGFDRDCTNKIHEHMASSGTNFLLRTNVTKITKDEETGKLMVTMDIDGGDPIITPYDTVMYATGRTADTANLQLENLNASLKADKHGKLDCVDEQTNVPNVFAVGDVLIGRPELTPVAIQAGELLARRLYKQGATKVMNYDLIATTVFTPAEYGKNKSTVPTQEKICLQMITFCSHPFFFIIL